MQCASHECHTNCGSLTRNCGFFCRRLQRFGGKCVRNIAKQSEIRTSSKRFVVQSKIFESIDAGETSDERCLSSTSSESAESTESTEPTKPAKSAKLPESSAVCAPARSLHQVISPGNEQKYDAIEQYCLRE